MEKTRIAILGGGPAALATAFELTNTPELRARYDITLHQIGWRAGGKCASSRNRARRGRNEEHGLHVLGGFYHNVFSQLRPLYAEWARVSPNTAIPFAEAFRAHNTFTLMERQGDSWRAVSLEMPTNSLVPGVNPEAVTAAEMLARIVGWLGRAIGEIAAGRTPDMWFRGVENWNAPRNAHHLKGLAQRSGDLVGHLRRQAHGLAGGLADRFHDHLREVQAVVSTLGEGMPPGGPDWLGVIELFAAMARGFVVDRLDARGFDSINDMEATAWLVKHGASARATACPLAQAAYHYSFAFEDGSPARPNIAAGVGLRGLLRMVFAYHGSVFFHMNGGMGEIVATPYFEVLRARGVRFHFFHRIEALIPGENGQLAEVRLRIQARPRGGADAYEPLFDYDPGDGAKPRRSWPEGPLYDQLEDGEALLAHGADLGSWEGSAGIGAEATLRAGEHFDICVAAMSIGTLRETSGALAAASPAWAAAMNSAGVTPTIAAQIWRREAVESFHGVAADGLMTSYVGPHDTWGDMSFLTKLEQPDTAGMRPASLSYFCGPITPGSGPGRASRPERETQLWLERFVAHAFPGLGDEQGGYVKEGEIERFARINDDPVDLYVCSPSGSIGKRLRPDGSGFSNLMLAGDWTRNNFDCGAVETAVLSAKLCARAISGSAGAIYGESDFA